MNQVFLVSLLFEKAKDGGGGKGAYPIGLTAKDGGGRALIRLVWHHDLMGGGLFGEGNTVVWLSAEGNIQKTSKP